jgi:peptide-methionine (S)-S-oxide reductase
MTSFAIPDPHFAAAVAAMDAGDLSALEALLAQHPHLLADRADAGDPGYFHRPYLIWFIADNPIRQPRLPGNVLDVLATLVRRARGNGVSNLEDQLTYALELVASGSVPRQCGLQLQLIDALVSAGARLDGDLGVVLGHGEFAAARRMLELGAPVSLLAAVSLDLWDEAGRLVATAPPDAKTDALQVAACLGKADAVEFLLHHGADPQSGGMRLHSHSTPLHQAALSGSLASVQALVRAGASLEARDSIWNGTPLGWARHGGRHEVAAWLEGAQH